MRCAALSALFCLLALSRANAEEVADPPPPRTMDSDGVQDWLDRFIKADGWTVFAFDEVAIAFGGPEGVEVLADETLRADVRHEYFRPTMLGDLASRSNRQTWIVDCKSKRYRVVAMSIFAANNLSGASESLENPQAAWQAVPPGSVAEVSTKRICSAPSTGHRMESGPIAIGSHAPHPDDDLRSRRADSAS